jgi:hypothetical protein
MVVETALGKTALRENAASHGLRSGSRLERRAVGY